MCNQQGDVSNVLQLSVQTYSWLWASEAAATATAIHCVAKQVIIFVIMLYFLYVSAYECRVGSVRDCSSEQQLGKTTGKTHLQMY